jgi:two-component system CheB/CheR fusion protein
VNDKSNNKTRGGNAEAPDTAAVPKQLVVGIGVSAAAPNSLGELLQALPAADRAIVVVVQYREALDERPLREALGATGGMLSRVQSGAPPEGGRVYLCEPGVIVTLVGGRFQTRPAQQEPGSRGTIDSFLVSLAEDRGEAAVGVVLHGMSGDGTLGFAALKERGGLTVAQQGPGETAADLATSNRPGALADFVLPIDQIPERIALYARQLARLRERKGLDALLAEVSGSLSQVATVLHNRTGHDFHGYKQQTFVRRVQRRMQVVGVEAVDEYLDLLRSQPEEVQNLFNDLLIGVTQFFRDPTEFEVLEREVIPAILDGKGTGDFVRIWVLGCATGEEAYSIAITLREEMARREAAPHVQIFATDIDARALATARVGRYSSAIAADMRPERLARWFIKEGDTYCVVKELREMCIFSAHNVIRDAPFSKLDLVSCRNLLIYLNAELQSRVIPLFHFALLPDRFLFLGNSENVTRHPKLFAPVDRRARIFRRLETGTRMLPDFPFTSPAGKTSNGTRLNRAVASDVSLERRAERVVERYTPAYVVTDEDFHVLHFSGRTGRYIEPSGGAASLDLLSLVHRDLRMHMRAALTKAAETGAAVRADQIDVQVNGQDITIDLAIEPVHDQPGGRRSFVVLFNDGPGSGKSRREPIIGADQLRDEHVLRLEGELRVTRERLQATIEELESTNEELKSSNEEYQSLNEELQSANEELETSREELQSVNEELTTVNSELAHRVHDLTRATSDLKNFLESTQIATLFLDNEFKVMNFTPAVTEIFHVVETDIGRPIGHIKARIALEELQEDVRRVLRTLTSVERGIVNPVTGARYIVRVLPYRSVDNFIAGVVVTFVDVTALTRAEERQKLLLSELQHRVRNSLSVVRSLARRTAATSGTVADYASNLDGRLEALGRVQAVVTRNPADGVDLKQIVVDELAAHGAQDADGADGATHIEGPAIRLQPKAAESFALAVHELATNAAKYGALATKQGRIRVAWTIDNNAEQPTLRFEWAESGVQMPDPASIRRGFGSDLIEKTLAYDLHAEAQLRFTPDGVVCKVRLPLPDRNGAGDSGMNPARAEPESGPTH